jgi:RalA-binding protein 1
MQKSLDDAIDDVQMDFTLQTKPHSDDESVKTITGIPTESATDTTKTPLEGLSEESRSTLENMKDIGEINNPDKITVAENGFLVLSEDHPEYSNLIRLQIENQELLNWKTQLQSRINQERSEIVRLKKLLNNNTTNTENVTLLTDEEEQDYERLIAHYLKENALLEQKRIMLSKEIFQERKALIDMEVEFEMKQYVH